MFNIFGKKQTQALHDLSAIGVDIHNHFIPAIDDGSQSLDESLELLRAMQQMGYSKIITTPHIQVDFYRNTPEIINHGLAALQATARANGIDIEISAAAEYHIDFLLMNRKDLSGLMTLKDKYLLFELSYFTKPPDFANILFELQVSGYQLVLAHPERYSFFYNNMGEYEKLKDRGILFQLNIGSLTGMYAKEVNQMAQKLIKEGMIDLVGSDLHRPHQIDNIKQVLSNKAMHQLLESGAVQNKSLFG